MIHYKKYIPAFIVASLTSYLMIDLWMRAYKDTAANEWSIVLFCIDIFSLKLMAIGFSYKEKVKEDCKHDWHPEVIKYKHEDICNEQCSKCPARRGIETERP